MINLTSSGGTITFAFDNNSGYLQNGTIEVPVNSLSLVIDGSDMVTFKKANSNDVFVSALASDFGMSKAQLISFYKDNMVGSTGGGGVTSGEVQTMIDESISGKVNTVDNQVDAYVESSSARTELTDSDFTLGRYEYSADSYNNCLTYFYCANKMDEVGQSQYNVTVVDDNFNVVYTGAINANNTFVSIQLYLSY